MQNRSVGGMLKKNLRLESQKKENQMNKESQKKKKENQMNKEN
jgi:hypothetical protein